jgi:UDP-4-amino-4,6-dideoxy-N-acetyl-beta-L-altrosamine transaminase
MIPYGRQEVTDADIAAVVAVLQSEFLTQGPEVPKFEEAVAAYCGAIRAVAVSNATAALHLACLALDVGPRDRVWTSPVSFVASANCALYCGAEVDFVDIESASGNLDVESLATKLADARTTGKLPKVVIPVHLCGLPCDMEAIHALSCEYGFRIIEDASHAIGARYRNGAVGNCRYSDAVVFSFHPVKIMTTGEGGMVLTNDVNLAEKIARLRSHGITRRPEEMTKAPDGPWYYQQIDLGYNYRMTDIQAALGSSQLKRLDLAVARRNRLAERYRDLLAELPVDLPPSFPERTSAMHLYVVRLTGVVEARVHRSIFEDMRASGIGVNLHYIPIHLQPYFQELGFRGATFPRAESYYGRAISLPMYPTLREQEQDQVARALADAIARHAA